MTTKTIRHGLSIGLERVNDEAILAFKAIGKLTHEDYADINAMIDSALEGIEKPKLKVFMDASEFEGWELRAAWDDFKLGLKHGREFEKIAIVSNKKWLEVGAKVAGWFTSGEVKTFDNAEDALNWLQE